MHLNQSVIAFVSSEKLRHKIRRYNLEIVERHLCIDTTAAGGNASLIAAGS